MTSTELEAKGTQKLDMSDVHRICSKSPVKCLPKINKMLNTTQRQSRVWYDLMRYKFESLFILQKIAELNKLTKPWINKENLPIPFEISVDIYYAKSLEENENITKNILKATRLKFIDRAEQRLTLMNNVYPNPYLLVRLANLQMRVGRYESAYRLLQSLLFKKTKYADTAFYLDLYGNLGHLADLLGYKIKAINYWETSLSWAKKLGNAQQTATVHYNLAQSQFTNHHYKLAKLNYIAAIKYATLASDHIKRIQAQLAMAKLLLKTGNTSEVEKIISTIDKNTLPDFLLPLFIHVKSQI